MDPFYSGGVAFGYLMAGLFFLRFWRRTNDRLFVMFALSFFILGVIRVAIVALGEIREDHYLYWFRLVSYLLILVAIVDKNLRK